MIKTLCGGILVGVIVAASLLTGTAQGAPTQQQRIKAKVVEDALKKSANLAKAKKFSEAGEALKHAQQLLGGLAAEGEDAAKLTAALQKQLATLHGELELQGVKLPPLDAKPDAAPSKASAPKKGGNVSFTQQVVPLLVGKCGGCHVRGSKGGFSAISYESLMKGTKDGPVVVANQKDSRLMQLIEDGDMPRSGGPLSLEDKAVFRQWIEQGARFDGGSPAANITDPNLIAATKNANQVEVDVQAATGKESVHFSTDIGPVLVEQCYGCHGARRRPGAKYDMSQFKGILKGGSGGEAVKSGKPADSLLIKKLRGTTSEGARMPKGKPALSEDVIAKFEKWISEGARFDGYDPAMNLRTVVDIAHAEKISHNELAKERVARAEHDLKRVLPDAGTEHEETENFIVYGNTGKDSLQEVAKQAEIQAGKLKKVFNLPSGPIVKGRTAIFVFDKKYDYDEVGRMLEKHELSPESRAHWRYDILDANVFIVPAKNNEYSLSGLLGQQIAAVVVASHGHVPHWFAEGSARAVAAGLDSKEARIRIWDDHMASILSSRGSADTILKGSGEDADILSYGFVRYLRSDPGRYQSLLTALHGHASFDAAFTKAYGGSPAQGAAAWVANPHRGGR
jgi:mono/diheme cytochrome c family protein